MADRYPPPILSNEPGSWAHFTVTRRLPEFVHQMMAENQFSKPAEERLEELIKDMEGGRIRHLLDQGAPDQDDWHRYIEPYLEKDWLEVPWFFAEHYFYRRIMEAVSYFQEGQDPFASQKQLGLEKSHLEIKALGVFLSTSLDDPNKWGGTLREGLYHSLWGNQADLSLWPAGSQDDPRHESRQSQLDHLLGNDIQDIVSRILPGDKSIKRVDMMVDNAGFELVADLGLTDLLLGLGLIETLVLHVKAHPTFVSDVIPLDVRETIGYLSSSQDQVSSQFGKRLAGYSNSGKLRVRESYFWNSPLPMWEFPDDLREEWVQSDLLISKGDANYRRILGDRQWDSTLPFKEAVDYLPVPLAALRTLKAELAVGLTLDQIQDVYNQDPNWMTDGRWGVIHFAPGIRE